MSKLDPRLTMLVRLSPSSLAAARNEWLASSHSGLPPVFSHPLHAHLRFKAGAPAPWVNLLVEFAGSLADIRPRLGLHGVVVHSVAGRILTAVAPLSAVMPVAHELGVVFLELGRFAKPQMDRTVPEIGAAALHHATPPVMGDGVVIGFIDVDGLDFYHPDLRRDDGTTRLTHLWDQQLEDATGQRTPAAWGYGSEFHAADINADLAGAAPYAAVSHRPVVKPGLANHATHTMGIAAGNGRASAGKYTGVAPRASLIYVNTFASGTKGLADLAEVCDAVAYVFDRAGTRPCVVNISLGDDLGPHDGTSLVEKFIDAKLAEKPGRAVVIAAGNRASTGQHAEVVLPASGRADLKLSVDAPVTTAEAWQIWYRGDDSLDVVVTAPDGTIASAPVSPKANPSSVAVTAGHVHILVTSTLRDGRNGDNVIEMIMTASGGQPIPVGIWTIGLSRTAGAPAPAGETRIHAWIDGNTGLVSDLGPSGTVRWDTDVASASLTTPATCEMAITVGNYMVDSPTKALSSTSSLGPTRGGRQKPDIAAPGGNGIHGPMGRVRGAPAAADGYILAVGTSMSAAHVSGLVALLFEMHAGNPLSASQTKQLLEQKADATGLTAVPDPEQGFGWGRARL